MQSGPVGFIKTDCKGFSLYIAIWDHILRDSTAESKPALLLIFQPIFDRMADKEKYGSSVD